MMKRRIPKPTSLDEAFAQIEDINNDYPVDAVELVYNHPTNERIVEKIVFNLENYFNEDVMYNESLDDWSDAGFWYAIIAENHLDIRYVKPICGLFAVDNDEDALLEQMSYLVGGLCEKYEDEAVSIFVNALEKYTKRKLETPYLYLIDCLYYADLDKYKNRILAFLQPDEHWIGSFANVVGELQIKEAAPILKKLIIKEEIKKRTQEENNPYDLELNELRYALESILTEKKEMPDTPTSWYKRRGADWKKHYNRFFSKVKQPPIKKKIGRNDPCVCGSGKKYKKCCMS